MSKRYNGIVRWYNQSKGYGFIKKAGVDEDIFVHANFIEDNQVLIEYDEVTFEIGIQEDGRTRAEKIRGGSGGDIPVFTPKPMKSRYYRPQIEYDSEDPTFADEIARTVRHMRSLILRNKKFQEEQSYETSSSDKYQDEIDYPYAFNQGQYSTFRADRTYYSKPEGPYHNSYRIPPMHYPQHTKKYYQPRSYIDRPPFYHNYGE
jgi:CspA family cold shock protein